MLCCQFDDLCGVTRLVATNERDPLVHRQRPEQRAGMRNVRERETVGVHHRFRDLVPLPMVVAGSPFRQRRLSSDYSQIIRGSSTP